jgi:hypothetical protein
MIRSFLLPPYRLAEPWLRHSNWMVRRLAQVVGFGVAILWLALPGKGKSTAEGDAPAQEDALADELVSSPQMREFLHGTAIANPLVGPVCRLLVLRLSVYAKMRESGPSDDRNFVLRLNGSIEQAAIRNLLIWQNHVLPAGVREDNTQVDVVLALKGGSESDARLFDLFSAALMLERVRSLSVFWDEQAAVRAASAVMSKGALARWHATEQMGDLAEMPRDITHHVAIHGTRGGVKLLQHGRRYANDFLKLALPGRLIIAVGLLEREDGTVEPEELELWLGLIDRLHGRHPHAAFVVLNCLTPSQWRQWPEYLRFPRHQGLSLQDAICLAQIADGYIGVLDLLGLAAHSAGRPGVYVPLEDGELVQPQEACESASMTQQIMVGSRHRAEIEAALENVDGFAPFHGVDPS